MAAMRLDKFLTETAGISRSEAKQQLKKGLVTIDGEIVKRPETKVDPAKDQIAIGGKVCHYQKYYYYMLHKPQGLVSATEDRLDKTVIDLIDSPAKDLFPVGRLDKDTEGLLLITNDGALSHRLLSPKKHVDKCYYARLDGPVGQKEIEAFEKGIDIGDEKICLPAGLKIREGHADEVYITIKEGRYHQVKRMAEAVGRKVVYLKRLSMGPLKLDSSLAPGEYRELRAKEVEELLAHTGLK